MHISTWCSLKSVSKDALNRSAARISLEIEGGRQILTANWITWLCMDCCCDICPTRQRFSTVAAMTPTWYMTIARRSFSTSITTSPESLVLSRNRAPPPFFDISSARFPTSSNDLIPRISLNRRESLNAGQTSQVGIVSQPRRDCHLDPSLSRFPAIFLSTERGLRAFLLPQRIASY